MTILNRYLVKTLAYYTVIVMLMWLAVFALLNFINEVDSIGQANYTIVEAMIYIMLGTPLILYDNAPVIILLGSILGLGSLVATSQVVIMRASGVSILRISGVVVRAALSFITVIILIGEFVAPVATEYAQDFRAEALGENVALEKQQGFWLKDGNVILNVKKNIDNQQFIGVTLIKFSDNQQLDLVSHSDRAVFDGTHLNLQKTSNHHLDYVANKVSQIASDTPEKYRTQVAFNQEVIDNLKKEPDELSAWQLYQQIHFLRANDPAANTLKIELYKRLAKPLTLMAMIVLSMLFIFGSLRDSSLGRKLFLGIILGLAFELLSRLSGALSMVWDYNLLLIATLPALVMLALSVFLLKRQFG